MPKSGGKGGYIPSIIWLWSAFERWMIFGLFIVFFRSIPDFGNKNSSSFGEDLFLVFIWFAQKRVKPFSYLIHVKKVVVELHPPKGQNRKKLEKNCKIILPKLNINRHSWSFVAYGFVAFRLQRVPTHYRNRFNLEHQVL